MTFCFSMQLKGRKWQSAAQVSPRSVPYPTPMMQNDTANINTKKPFSWKHAPTTTLTVTPGLFCVLPLGQRDNIVGCTRLYTPSAAPLRPTRQNSLPDWNRSRATFSLQIAGDGTELSAEILSKVMSTDAASVTELYGTQQHNFCFNASLHPSSDCGCDWFLICLLCIGSSGGCPLCP